MFNLTADTKLTRVMNGVVAGTTDQNSAAVDMTGFGSVTFIAAFGALTANAVTSVKVQDATASTGSWVDLAGSSVSVATTRANDIVAVEIIEPQKRWLRGVIDRGTANAIIDGMIAVQALPKIADTTHDSASVVAVEAHLSPATGTA